MKTTFNHLPKVSGSKRGPKRMAKARKIARDGFKNWHARASMWLDGVASKDQRFWLGICRWTSPQVSHGHA